MRDTAHDRGSARISRIFGWVSLFQDLGSKMVLPILPLFLTQVLGAPPVAVGLSDGVADATASASASIGGRLADRGRPIPLVRFGYGLSSASKLLLAFVTWWPAAISLRITDRIGKGVRDAPRDVVLASSSPRAGSAFGLQQAMDKAGGALGPLAGLAVFHLAGERYRPVFVAAFVPCAISVALLWRIRSDVGVSVRSSPAAAPAGGRLQRAFWWSVSPFVLLGAARLGDGLMILRVEALGASTTELLLSFSAMRAVTALAAYPAGRLADRIRPEELMTAGGAVLAAAHLALAFGDRWLALWVIVPMTGLADPLLRTPTKLAVLQAAGHQPRGRALGDTQTAIGLASLVVGVAAGAAWSGDGRLPFAVAGVVTLATAWWSATRSFDRSRRATGSSTAPWAASTRRDHPER
jgi:sugar phosphate permease